MISRSTTRTAVVIGMLAVSVAIANESPYGYWLMRAPVSDADYDEGVSYPKRFGTTGNPMFPNGNGQDIGVMWRPETLSDEGRPLDTEERHCGAWFNVYFDEPGFEHGTIENIYCHVWVLRGNTVGMSTAYNGHTFEENLGRSVQDLSVERVNNYDLVIYHIEDWDWRYDSAEQFHSMSFKGNARPDGGGVQLLSYANQRSFCLVNLPDESALRQRDTDGDGLNDHLEHFETYTDPYDTDTDDDGFDDRHEFDNSRSGVDPYDWHRIRTYDRFSPSMLAFISSGDHLIEEPTVAPWTSVLSRSLQDDELEHSVAYDLDVNRFTYDTVLPGYWGFMQLNYQFTIDVPADDIIDLSVFWGGRNGPWEPGRWNDQMQRLLRVADDALQGGIVIPGRKGYSPAMFMKSFAAHEVPAVLNDENQLHFGFFSKQRRTSLEWEAPWEVDVDYAGVRVVSHGNFLEITEPELQAPEAAEPGESLEFAFALSIGGGLVDDDVIIEGVSINGLPCPLLEEADYDGDAWRASCEMPSVSGAGQMDLSVWHAGELFSIRQSGIVYGLPEFVAPVIADSVTKNRYVSFLPPDDRFAYAYRVTVNRSELFPETEGQAWWVGLPAPDGTCRLTCAPEYFLTGSMIDVGDLRVVPQTTYVVEATLDGETFSEPVEVSSIGVWGDVVGNQIGESWTPPNGVANFVDVWACVRAFQGRTDELPLSWTDINSNRITDFGDIAYVIEGVRGLTYNHGLSPGCDP